MAKIKKKIMTSNDNDVEKMERSHSARGLQNGNICFKQFLTLPSNFSPEYIPKRNENISTQKHIYKCLWYHYSQ